MKDRTDELVDTAKKQKNILANFNKIVLSQYWSANKIPNIGKIVFFLFFSNHPLELYLERFFFDYLASPIFAILADFMYILSVISKKKRP